MDNIIQIINIVLPVILMLAIGMLCRRHNILSREGIGALKSVAVNIALPAVMLNAFSTMNYTANTVFVTLLMFLVCVAGWLLGKILGKILHLDSRFTPFITTGFEAGMLGYSLFILLYGSENLGSFATVDLGQVLFVFTLYKLWLNKNEKQAVSASQLAREMFTSPTVIAILAGIVLGATGIYSLMTQSGINTIIDSCTDFVSAPTGAIILLCIGYDLVPGQIPWLRVGKVSFLRIIIMLVLRIVTGLVVRALGMDNSLDYALNVMFILPSPFVLPVFADDEQQRTYVSSTLSVSTCITIIGFIILAIIK